MEKKETKRENSISARGFLLGYGAIVGTALLGVGALTAFVDPYMHYHAPRTERYFYTLDNQRSQNDGITKHFSYDALITGTSMTDNFKTSEMDAIFGTTSIKVTYDGGTYKEINDNLKVALRANPSLTTIVRGLDIGMFFEGKDEMRVDMGDYPTYLYDRNPFNDVKYLYNRDVLFGRIFPMESERGAAGFAPGITSFDEYARWQDDPAYVFGRASVIPNGMAVLRDVEQVPLTDEERAMIRENIAANVTDLADAYPEVDFYYFFTPYSAAWWNGQLNFGLLDRQIEAEREVIECILPHRNIHLYSFSHCPEITANFDNYKDAAHYGEWINTAILRWMQAGEYLLTPENYETYLETEHALYRDMDYEGM